MARTTLDIDASILRLLRQRQQKEHKTLGELVSELLAKALADEAPDQAPAPLEWTSKRLGLKIDLEDKDAVWAVLDNG